MPASPAIALIEFSSIAAGAFAADHMVKQADVELLRAGTVQPGKYLVLFAGSEADVEIAHRAGISAAGPQIIDDIYLPDPHEQLVAGIQNKRNTTEADSLAILETSHVAAILRASDAALKSARVDLLELRLADGLGGKGLAHLTGERSDIEYAIESAQRALAGRDGSLCHSIISRIDDAFAQSVHASTRFAEKD